MKFWIPLQLAIAPTISFVMSSLSRLMWRVISRTNNQQRLRSKTEQNYNFHVLSMVFVPPRERFSCVLLSCRLVQQYMVDHFCNAEAEKLSYIREQQAQVRAYHYTRLLELLGDSGRMEDESRVVYAGRLFMLPSTKVCWERCMAQLLDDITDISNEKDHPDFFCKHNM